MALTNDEKNWVLVGYSGTPGDWVFVQQDGDEFVMVTNLDDATRFTVDEASALGTAQRLPGLTGWYRITPVEDRFAEYLSSTFTVYF